MTSFSTLNATAKRLFVGTISLLALAAFSVGCQRGDDAPEVDPNAPATADANAVPAFPQFSVEVRNLSAEKLAELGAKNDLPTENIYPNAYFAFVLRPDRIRGLADGADALSYFETSTLQLPKAELLKNADLVISSKTFSLETLKDAKTDAVLQENFPAPAEAVYLRSTEPLDQAAILDAVFNVGGPNDKVKPQTFGGVELQTFENSFAVPLDQTGQNLGKIEKALAGVCFPTPNSVLLLSGSASAFESFFSGKPGDERGIVAQQAGRLSTDSLDAAFLYDYDMEVATTQLVPLPFPITPELGAAIQKHSASFRFVANASQADGDLLTLTVDAKSPEGAAELKKTIGGALMQVVDNLGAAAKAAQTDAANQPPAEQLAELENLTQLLKQTSLNVDGAKVVGTLKNAPEALEFLGGTFRQMNAALIRVEQDTKYAAVDQALFQLGRAFTAHLGKNQTFPKPILAADGTPLLSWRVALLPTFGPEGQKLFDEFKLDEPWNGENNIKLLDKMPAIFASPLDSNLGTKTRFLVVNTPNAPFGKATEGLKIQDVSNPTRTLAVVCAAAKHAVEWTRPETFAFNPEAPTESFGDVLCGVTLMGEIVRFAIDDSPETARQIANLVFGTVDEPPAPQAAEPAATEEAAPVETPQTETAEEAQPVENADVEATETAAPTPETEPAPAE